MEFETRPATLTVQGASSSSGSGLILEANGTILTSAQIVLAAAESRRGVNGQMQLPKVFITLQDGRIFQGRVISLDRYSVYHPLKPHSCRLASALEGADAGFASFGL